MLNRTAFRLDLMVACCTVLASYIESCQNITRKYSLLASMQISNDVAPMNEIPALSKLFCSFKCNEHNGCHTFVYDSASEKCLLYESCRKLESSADSVVGHEVTMTPKMDCECSVDGPRTISLANRNLTVFCQNQGIIMMNRHNNSDHIWSRTWFDYSNGFGGVHDIHQQPYWIGNEALHLISNQANYTLVVDMVNYYGQNYSIQLGKFKVGSEEERYILEIADWSGDTPGNGRIFEHNGRTFSTLDNTTNGCNIQHGGGWWYSNCAVFDMTGYFLGQGQCSGSVYNKCFKFWGISAAYQQDLSIVLSSATMMLKRT